MKSRLLLYAIFLNVFVFSTMSIAQEQRDRWSYETQENIIPAIEMKSNTDSWTVEMLWEVDITQISSMPHPSGYGNVNPTGVATDGDVIFVSADNMAELYKFEFDGSYIGSVPQVDGVGAVVDINYYDGKFMGGWFDVPIHRFDIENNTYVDVVIASVSNGVMGYDETNDIIYSCGERNTGYGNPINIVDGSDGSLISSFARQNNRVYSGLAYDPRVPCLWGLCNNTSSKNTLVQLSLPSGQETGVVIEMPDYFSTSTYSKPAGGLSVTFDESENAYIFTGVVKERFVWGAKIILEDSPDLDAAILSMVNPLTDMGLLGSENIGIRIKNEGNSTINNIPILCGIDGETPIEYIVNESIAAGEFIDYTLPISVDFNAFGDAHTFEISVDLDGDENEENNSIIYTAESIEPYYYEANSYCEWGDGILSFELDDIVNHNTGCTNSGYEDYTSMNTNCVIGNTYTAKIATDGPTQGGLIWIDFNKDYVFDNELELVTDLFMVPEDGVFGEFDFTIPMEVEPGTYRLRCLVEWVLEDYPYYPNAQVDMGYGEMEDYTLIITEENIELDAGIYDMNMAEIIPPGNINPGVIVKNYGNSIASFNVTASSDGYTSTIAVENLGSKETVEIVFDEFEVSNGDYIMEFCTDLDGDEVAENDCGEFKFRVCDSERETVLVEIGTGTWCGFCPGAAMGADELVENGKNVAIVEYHGGDSYTIDDGITRLNYYAVTSYPTSVFDGINRHTGGHTTSSIYDDMLPLYEEAIEIPSAYNINAFLSESSDGVYNLDITVANPFDYEDEDLRLFAVLTESHIPESWQILDELNFVARAMYPNGQGAEIEFNASGHYNQSFIIEVPATYDIDHCEIAIFVQEMESKMVWQTKLINFDMVGLDIISRENQISVYPNPSAGIINIEANESILEILVFDAKGQLYQTIANNGSDNTIRISELRNGFYTLKIKTAQGVCARKVIVNSK